MRQFMTSTVEQRKDFKESFSTHPMEVAWATEAIFFITIEEVKCEGARLKPRFQVSVDGVNWIEEGTAFEPLMKCGQYFQRVTHFGGWLRLYVEMEGDAPLFNLTIHLVLKE